MQELFDPRIYLTLLKTGPCIRYALKPLPRRGYVYMTRITRKRA